MTDSLPSALRRWPTGTGERRFPATSCPTMIERSPTQFGLLVFLDTQTARRVVCGHPIMVIRGAFCMRCACSDRRGLASAEMKPRQTTQEVRPMPTNQEIAQMAHLMRRAGFGATYAELEQRAAAGYEATVEELLDPIAQPDLEMDILERHFVDWKEMNALEVKPGVYHLPDDQHQAPAAGEDGHLLAWDPVHGQLQVRARAADPVAVGHVPRPGHGQLRCPVERPVPGPGHGVLPGQLHEPQGRHQRELGPRAPGTVLAGRRHGRRGQLLRG